MTKLEMEKAIINGLKEIKAHNDELDAEHIAYYKEEGFTDKPFLFNGYIYCTDIENILTTILFNKKAYDDTDSYFSLNITEDERIKVEKVINGLEKAKIIKLSKTRTMAKVLI